MRMKTLGVLLAAVLSLVVGTPLAAHHGAASYDLDKELTMKGTVTDWLWANPHCILKYDSVDDAGNATHWVVEVGNPVGMTSRGWSRQTFKPGDKVTVTMHPARNGYPVGQLLKVVLPSGQTLQAGAIPGSI